MTDWQVQEAKTRLSEVIERAQNEGPQTITRHGKPRAVVLSVESYESLRKKRPSLVEYLRHGPSFEGVNLKRSKDTGRAIKL
jgi:prevent-host-death family protein